MCSLAIGRNGAGKTPTLRILAGEVELMPGRLPVPAKSATCHRIPKLAIFEVLARDRVLSARGLDVLLIWSS